MTFLILVLQYLGVVTIVFSLVFAVGIVWRTEKKLDLTYRFIFVALVGFLGARVISLGYFLGVEQQALVAEVLDFIGVLFLLLSILEMRDIIRVLDKEK